MLNLLVEIEVRRLKNFINSNLTEPT